MFVFWEQAKAEATCTEALTTEAPTVETSFCALVNTMNRGFIYKMARWLLWGADGAYVKEYISLGQVGSNNDGLQMKRVFTG